METNNTRQFWVDTLERVARPMLEAAKARKLRETMRIEQHENAGREEFSVFEGAGRLLCGISAWLDAELPEGKEKDLQTEFANMARELIAGQVDPKSPDYANFEETCRLRSQILVDAAFLAQAVLRAPKALWQDLSEEVKQNLLNALRMTRKVCPGFNNWLLFSSEIEAALRMMTGEFDAMRMDYAIRQTDQWYVGDGLYSDGPSFALDYYNSYVIQPMLLDTVKALPEIFEEEYYQKVLTRAKRYGVIQEKMIAPDGSFIIIGRSIPYRCGAFHLLAQLALMHELPEEFTPGRVRSALTAVIGRTLGDASFREDGFLNIGVCASQPAIGEFYISTGSLYLCSCAFLPLGLSPDDPFWTDPAEDWSQKQIWSGQNFPLDHKL